MKRIEGRSPRSLLITLLITALALLFCARFLASYVIEYRWWQEVGQLPTWWSMLLYTIAPVAVATLLAFILLWVTHARALKFAGTGLAEHPLYAKLATLVLLGLAFLLASSIIDSWTVVRYFGGRSMPATASAWHDQVFGLPLAFYFFELPFYSVLLRLVLTLAIVNLLLYWLVARGWQLRMSFPGFGDNPTFDINDLRLRGALESPFLRGIGVLLLFALAGQFFFDRYRMLFNEHGFLVGVDYVNDKIGLPLQWLAIFAASAAALLLWFGFRKLALAMVLVMPLKAVVPIIVSAAYVRPNEIALQKPYIQRHIESTRSAYKLDQRVKEVQFAAKLDVPIDLTKYKPLLDNVRLWDWRAFHDTVTQIQPLRPYIFADTDIDRYTIDGQLRQVLLTARELDIRQLAEARTSWINPHFIYTHGYGIVVAEANRITADGLPVLFIEDAPPVVKTKSLQLTRPEIYYSEISHEPVFVRTAQPEFNYPSGSENVHTRYDGSGGFPISSVWMRAAAAVDYGDWNILLTNNLTAESRMIIHRVVLKRLSHIAGFIHWDTDPYIVLNKAGRLVWMADGYMTSAAHPYSRSIGIQGIGEVNYIRNSVKATVDAYDGTTQLYIFDPSDPLIQAYSHLFPNLLKPASEMPADLREHARFPEILFRAQAEIYRTFHMRDPEAFYNKADLWDLAKSNKGQGARPDPVTPTYVVATLPGEDKPEFLLLTPFTPSNKDNLIGLMAARCDGEHLGELVFLQLSKQAIVFGPMQIDARINQDQNISKDLTLWNQQGSQVLRGQMLVLPIGDTFLYVQPIYIQASEARMPQLKKVALAMGNSLVYADTYEQALADLRNTGQRATAPSQQVQPAAAIQVTTSDTKPRDSDPRIENIRGHLRRYKELAAQGKWAEAGKELEAMEAAAQKP